MERRSIEELRQAAKQGFDYWSGGNREEILDEWPAQEFYEVSPNKSPYNWEQLWRAAGGKFYGGRMIALKNDPIWCGISRFGLPYEPFDEYCQMGVRYVARNEAEQLGLLARDTVIEIAPRIWQVDLQKIK